MNFRAIPAAAAAVFAGALLFTAAPASATLITYDSYSVVNNTNVTIGFAGISPGPYGSGQINSFLGGTKVATSWCIDVTHDLYGSGQWNVIDAVDNAGTSNIDNGGGNGTLMSSHLLGELGALAAYGNANLNSNPDLSSAVQLAMWDVEYGSAITTTSASASVQALANQLSFDAVQGLLGSDTDVAALQYCTDGGCNQGQLIVLGPGDFRVPEPSSLALLLTSLLGITGFAAARRRRR